MTSLTFWAQALDNAAPDHISAGGALVGEQEVLRRQEVVSLISAVIKSGDRIFDERGTRLTADARHFVLEIPSSERDVTGRVAPIVCWGEYGPAVSDDLGQTVALAAERFAREISRTLVAGSGQVTSEAFDALKKKSSRRRVVRASWIVLAILMLLGVLYSVASRGS